MTSAGTGQPVHGKLAYRDDIDGLRAIAVLPIVLFHAGVSSLGGGFIGVDIFFVISGFLITGIIRREMDEGSFSLGGFYRRRIVRIFPALFAMLLATLLAAILLFFPSEIRTLSRSVAAAAASVSNFLFWQETGYFAASAETNPLLHTWSLAVEEQFYLFFPLVLLLVVRWLPRLLKPLMWLMVLASLAVGLALTQLSENAAFYLLPGRMWELGLGAVVALGAIPAVKGALQRQLAAWAGLLAIATSYALVRADMPFPVPTALPVCLGTAALIAYGQGTAVASGLAHPWLRFIGRISYSVYLWHWPIITFYRIEYGFELDLAETACLTTASLVAGWLSYRLVEQPALLHWRATAPRPVVLAGLGAMAIGLGAAGLSWRHAESLTRFDPAIVRIAEAAEYRQTDEFAQQYGPPGCFIDQARESSSETARQRSCEKLSGSRPAALLVGDSFGGQFATAIPERFNAFDWSLAIASGCRPTVSGEGTARCRAIADRTYNEILPRHDIALVVLAGRWLEEDIPHIGPSIRAARENGAKVVLLGPLRHFDSSFPLLFARVVSRGAEHSKGGGGERNRGAPGTWPARDRSTVAGHRAPRRRHLRLDAGPRMSRRAMPDAGCKRRPSSVGLWAYDLERSQNDG